MGRRVFQLSDAQARTLVAALPAIDARHPAGGRDHRPFVRDFMRAVFDATGHTFSPVIMRRLLAAYAPERTPSTDTLAAEKRWLDGVLAQEAAAGRQLDSHDGEALVAVVERAVARALDQRPLVANGSARIDPRAATQVAFLHERLLDVEAQLRDAQAQAARLQAELDVARAQRAIALAQQEEGRAAQARQTAQLDKLAAQLDSMRKFALSAVDGVRGETRAWQDRSAALEERLKQERRHAEFFRQIAYQRGAPMPPDLRE